MDAPLVRTYPIRPPYTEYEEPRAVSGSGLLVNEMLLSGTLIAIALDPLLTRMTLHTLVRAARQQFPGAPVVGRVTAEMRPDLLHLIHDAAVVGIRAVVHDQEPLEPTLRRLLTEPSDLAKNLADWFAGDGTPFRPGLYVLLRRHFDDPSGFATVAMLADQMALKERALRRRFDGWRLPAPRQWIGLSRILCLALDLQREPSQSLASFAMKHGYADQPSLTRAFSHTLGFTPAQVRRRLGWEWMALAWLRKHAATTTGRFDHIGQLGPN